MTALNCDPCYGTLAIAGVPLCVQAWCLPDLSALWIGPSRRGADVVIPHLAGSLPQVERRASTAFSLRFIVTGALAGAGVAAASTPSRQLEANWAYLMANVLKPLATGTGTRTVTWTLPSGASVSAAAHVSCGKALSLGTDAVLRTTVELIVPGGDLIIPGG